MNHRNFNDITWDNDIYNSDVEITGNAGTFMNYEVNQERDTIINPYSMDRHCVKAKHFSDARLYDDTIEGSEWQVSKYYARMKYRKWLSDVRSEAAWVGFHRPPREEVEEIEGDDGKIYTIKKIVPYKVPGLPYKTPFIIGHRRGVGRNSQVSLLPQARIKGTTICDEKFRAKMFTITMGQKIARLRNDAGLTQAELAKKINVDAATIRNIELGNLITFNSEDKMVKELAKALNIPSIKYQD